MFEKLMALFSKVSKTASVVLNRPEHIRLSAGGKDVEDCLRALEREAGLPKGDLSIKGKPMKMASFPSGARCLRYGVDSKTSDSWEKEGRIGYMSGSILEADKPIGAILCLGTLHVSKNCPGVYRDNVCTTCGDSSL